MVLRLVVRDGVRSVCWLGPAGSAPKPVAPPPALVKAAPFGDRLAAGPVGPALTTAAGGAERAIKRSPEATSAERGWCGHHGPGEPPRSPRFVPLEADVLLYDRPAPFLWMSEAEHWLRSCGSSDLRRTDRSRIEMRDRRRCSPTAIINRRDAHGPHRQTNPSTWPLCRGGPSRGRRAS